MKVNFSDGNFLKAADIPQPVIATIKSVTMETMQQNEQPKVVVSFNELSKPLVLNKTNGNIIVGLYGDDTDRWNGQPIEIYATVTSFQGRQVPCTRVRQPQGQQPAGVPVQPSVPQLQPQHQAPAPPLPAPPQQPQYQAPAPPQPSVQAPPPDVPFDA